MWPQCDCIVMAPCTYGHILREELLGQLTLSYQNVSSDNSLQASDLLYIFVSGTLSVRIGCCAWCYCTFYTIVNHDQPLNQLVSTALKDGF